MLGQNVKFIEKAGLLLRHLSYMSPRGVGHLSTEGEARHISLSPGIHLCGGHGRVHIGASDSERDRGQQIGPAREQVAHQGNPL
jgi:hypothetical protein